MEMKNALAPAVSVLMLVAAGYGATLALGPALAPPPPEVVRTLAVIGMKGDLLRELAITVARAMGGLALANLFGLCLGLCAGLIPFLSRICAPLITALQACPTIVWISLALVWAGTGSAVPVAAVFAATLPPLFVGTVQGVLSLDKRALAMSRLYRVPWSVRLRRLLLPGVVSFWLAAFSHTLAAGWKVAAMAEFFGSSEGVGTRIFWAYRRMDMSELFAWTFAIILLGVGLEYALTVPLRKMAARMGKKFSYQEGSYVAS
ncbi:MAG: putative aliphatic sulfonates transport permease protein SsuC [Syntrophorhabdaceae bacterium PtaU1.Bin034]|nr:MAG: putative aliphatic sulfonates transport permease protein SsuC [Syntrophorhabdaceae bacterium PtaU1.Bin034]